MHYSAWVISAGVEQGGMALAGEFVCSPWNIFLVVATFFGNEIHSRNRKRVLSHVFMSCWNVLSCEGDLTLSSWLLLLWALPPCQSFSRVEQNCNKSSLWTLSKQGSITLSHWKGCTSHSGNKPHFPSQREAARALSWASHFSCSSPDVPKGLCELQPSELCWGKGRESSAHMSRAAVTKWRRREGEMDWEAWSSAGISAALIHTDSHFMIHPLDDFVLLTKLW